MQIIYPCAAIWPTSSNWAPCSQGRERKKTLDPACGGTNTTTLVRKSNSNLGQFFTPSLSLFLRQVAAGHSHLFSSVTEGHQTLLPWTFWGAVIQSNYQILPVKTWWIRGGGEPTRNLKNQRSSPWPRLELFFQLNDNRFCLRNCYVIWCMGVIWLRTRDGSTSHKILPEFPDLCVLCCFYLLLGLFTCFRNIKKRTSLEIQKATENLLNSFI